MELGFLVLIANLAMVVTCRRQVIRAECQERCGNVTIPYPFGVGKDCALDHTFTIFCNDINGSALARPFLSDHALDIINISLDGHLRKHTYVTKECFNSSGHSTGRAEASSTLRKPFHYSSTLNKFTTVGCDTFSKLISVSGRNRYALGCLSACTNISSATNGSCSGIGCCQTSVPKLVSKFEVTLSSVFNYSHVWDFNPCSYAFIADSNFFNFSTAYLQDQIMPATVPTVLDWAVGDQTCLEAMKNHTSYACKNHSFCQDSDNGPGYRCFCRPGYQGNPYLPDGCFDVDECQDSSMNDCLHKCHNVEGNYTCSCPNWYHGDGRRKGQRCDLDQNKIIHVVIGGAALIILLVLGSLALHIYMRKRKERRLREKFFKQNGGSILQSIIARGEKGSMNTMRIFPEEELKKATDDFSEDKICGRGGFGTVYKGHLSDGRMVAIKMSKTVDRSQIEQFINEITILSQINHRNVVRFLGCCFETPVPLLVYEFIRNGTLSDHIHNNNNQMPRMPWSTRLKIATETAGVLAYLHSAHSPPIIHRDIKPTNILLDEDFASKVSDFGASRLVPKDENEKCTMVQGTLGYLDPEYLQTGQLNEKSDVYSFGVVLVELLTGLNAVSLERSEQERSLAYYFLSLMKEDSSLKIVEKGMMKEENSNEVMEVAKIAEMCLRVKGEERPTMKEVAMELEGLVMELKHKWAKNETNVEETEFLISKGLDNGDSIQMAEYSGNGNDFLLQIR